MLNAEDAQRALQSLSGKSFLGRLLNVKPCVQKHIGRTQNHSHHLSAIRWNTTSKGRSPQTNNRPLTDQTGTATFNQRYEEWRVYVGGLPKPTNNQMSDLEIRELFRDFNVQAVSNFNWPHEKHGRYSAYHAFVHLELAKELRRAVRILDGIKKWGGTIAVKPTRRAGTTTQYSLGKDILE